MKLIKCFTIFVCFMAVVTWAGAHDHDDVAESEYLACEAICHDKHMATVTAKEDDDTKIIHLGNHKEYQFSFGGGIATGGVKFDNGIGTANFRPAGMFIVWRAVCNEDGATLELSVSETSDRIALTLSSLQTKFRRFGFDAGYTFNRTGEFRPFITGGFAYLQTEMTMNVSGLSVRLVDDGSMAVTLSVGIEAGKGGSTFYAKILKDIGYRIHPEWINVPLARARLDSEQFRIGYVYRY